MSSFSQKAALMIKYLGRSKCSVVSVMYVENALLIVALMVVMAFGGGRITGGGGLQRPERMERPQP